MLNHLTAGSEAKPFIQTGRVNAVYPGSSLHYIHAIRSPRWEDMELSYHNSRNQWAFLGMGLTTESLVDHLDKSPYLREENIVSAVTPFHFRDSDVRLAGCQMAPGRGFLKGGSEEANSGCTSRTCETHLRRTDG